MEGEAQRASQQTKLAMAVFVIFVVLILIISVVTYTTIRASLVNQYEDRTDDAVVVVTNHVFLVDAGLNTYESAYDRELMESFVPFLEAYEISGRDPFGIDLSSLRDNISLSNFGTLELYIVNESGVVESSTYAPDVGLDFSKYPKFYDKLTNIRMGNEFVGDRATSGWADEANLKKYAYMPTPDHKYLLEFGFTSDVFEEGRRVFRYSGIGDLLSDQNYNLISTKIYSVVHKEVGGGPAGDQAGGRLDIAFTEKSDLEYSDPSAETVTKYIYIDLDDGSSPSSSQMSLVAELVFSTEDLNNTLNMLTFYVWMFLILASGISLLSAYYMAYYFTKPIRSIIHDIEIITDGDLNHTIKKTQSAEGEYLRGKIEVLVNQLKGEIELLKKTSENLDIELDKNRIKESELEKVNKKLSLISGITLHDIQNQILALSSYVRYLKLNRSCGGIGEEHLKVIDDVAKAVREHISFSSDYRQVGLKKPLWQNINSLVKDITAKDSFDKISFSVNTCSLEILADPMFKKVLYNLFENSVRHGRGVRNISVSFFESYESGHLIIEDDGCGIADADKERIFVKKYGSNSGLGLFLAREILATSEMDISETGVAGKGAVFDIIISKENFRFM